MLGNTMNNGAGVESTSTSSRWSINWGVWGRELTDAEILILYNAGNGKSYPF